MHSSIHSRISNGPRLVSEGQTVHRSIVQHIVSSSRTFDSSCISEAFYGWARVLFAFVSPPFF